MPIERKTQPRRFQNAIPINTSNINIDLLKTRRKGDRVSKMCWQGVGYHTQFRQVDHPNINQVLYGMIKCYTNLNFMSLSLRI